jgi:hypothetical protein
MTERRTPDPSSSRVPVHSALVQKSVTAITNLVGRLSPWMLGKTRRMRKGKLQKRWQSACNQSNHVRDSGLAMISPVEDFPAESCAASGPARTFVYKPDQDPAIPISVRLMSCASPPRLRPRFSLQSLAGNFGLGSGKTSAAEQKTPILGGAVLFSAAMKFFQ